MHIDLSHLPNDPGVYLFKDASGTIIYIGKAKNLQKRVSQYFAPGSLRKQEMLAKANAVDFLVVKNENEALYLENNLIKKHKPFYNTMLKGGNGYTYIKLTSHPFPQILLTRTKKNDKATYIGPKHTTQELKKLLQYLRQVLGYRTCPISQFKQKKVCSDFYFGLCKGWCALAMTWLTQPDYKALLQLFISFFKGNTKPIEKDLKQKIDLAIQQENFERAAKLRDIYLHIEQFVEKQHVELPKNTSGYVVEIRQIWTRNVFVLLNFYEGRLIDVIREKVSVDEGDFSHMLAGFEMEIGELIPLGAEGMIVHSQSMKFLKSEEQALQQMLDKFFDSYVISASFEGDNLQNELLQTLQKRYGLKKFPYRMECVDISHLSGSWISGGLTCMIGGLLEKKGYRKYKIQSVKGQSDDYASLKEVLERRLKYNEPRRDGSWTRPNGEAVERESPDLFILDGGKGQLGVVKKLYEENEKFRSIFETLQFIALGKGEARKKSAIGSHSTRSTQDIVGEHIYRFDENWNIIEIPLIYDQADKLLIKLRDEAHRFSNYYRKQQMSKELTFSK